jgi:TRAP-type mannitol/chloroaromatic compound transport system permease small subunit
MNTQRLLLRIDRLSEWSGKLSAWLIVILALAICIEVFKRYVLNAPTAWIFDLTAMLYGTLFMMCGAYTLAQNGHVRGDFLYRSMRPRTQAALDLALYILFFIPGIAALMYAGIEYTVISWKIDEHSNITAGGPPVYQFKAIIPIAGTLLMIQGIAEIVRCVVCLRTGAWPDRLKDVEEISMVEAQLAQSEFIDEEARRQAIARVQEIEEEARRHGSVDVHATDALTKSRSERGPRDE